MSQFLKDGFPGERLYVLPRPLIRNASQVKPTDRLLVTDAGYFPHASRHGRSRKTGARQAIVILCTAGAGWVELRGQRHDVREGEFLVIGEGEPHRYFADELHPWSIWWLHITGPDVPGLLEAIGLTAQEPVAPVLDLYQMARLVEMVCDAMRQDETSASLAQAAGAAWHLLACLAAERGSRGVSGSPIARVQSYLRENLAEPVSIPDLAARAGFSPSHFSARFKEVTGFSPIDYVKRLRMARARQLLLTTELTVAEIGERVGYPDPFYFSRQFGKVTGVSPRAFRVSDRGEIASG